MKFNVSRTLALSSWLIGLDGCPESMAIGNVVDLPQIAMGIGVGVTALDVSVTVAVLLSRLLEISGMVISSYDVVPVLVRDWLSLQWIPTQSVFEQYIRW